MPRPEKVLPLTSLRFFAALGIVFHHYFGNSYPALAQNRWLAPVIDYSGVAVYFFFILSGYILSHVYLRPERAIDRRKFAISRFARIYPLYIATIVVSVPGLFAARLPRFGWLKASAGTAGTFMTHALLVQHWIPQLGALNYPSWSISAETFFYVVFPWLGVALWRRSTRSAIRIGAIWFVASWAVLVAGWLWPRLALVPHAMPLFELNYFVLGIVLAKGHAAMQASARGRARLLRWGGMLAAGSLGTFLLFTEYRPHIGLKPLHDAVAAILFLGMILGFASGHAVVQALATARWLVVLGESSYGLYLIHAPLYPLMYAVCGRWPQWFFPMYVLAAIMLSVASFYFFETPVRRAILRWFAAPSRESTVEAAMAQ